jgi:hypothetical protein
MSVSECKNVTDSVSRLSHIIDKFDSNLGKYTPKEALEIRREFELEAKDAYLAACLGQENLEYFVDLLGSQEELRSRVVRVEIGGIPVAQINEMLEQNKIPLHAKAEEMLQSPFLTTQSLPQKVWTFRLSLEELGLDGSDEMVQVYMEGLRHGLGLCPAEVGPRLALVVDKKAEFKRQVIIAMKALPDEGALSGLVFIALPGLHLSSKGSGHASKLSIGTEYLFALKPKLANRNESRIW